MLKPSELTTENHPPTLRKKSSTPPSRSTAVHHGDSEACAGRSSLQSHPAPFRIWHGTAVTIYSKVQPYT